MSQQGSEPEYEIILRDPQSVLQKQLGTELKVLHFKAENFLKVGDNYGSTILKLQLLVKRDDGAEEENLHLVAKMLPPTNFQRMLFETAFSFKKEIFVYESLIPTYQSLYNGVFEILPKFYGSRLSIRDDVDEVEEDALILMEDLKSAGYYMQDRRKGLDLEHTKAIVSSLAKFHAIGLSVKQKDPSYLSAMEKYMKSMTASFDLMEPYFENVFDCIKRDPEISLYYDRIVEGKSLKQFHENYFKALHPEDPWACVIHSDLWTNNILFHTNDSGNIDMAKMVDFQLSYISSPLSDLIFCLCTSMEKTLNPADVDEMLELYRKAAIGFLKELECDVDLFSRENFEKRLKIDAINERFHILMMCQVIELHEGEDLKGSLNSDCLYRLKNVLKIFSDKGWI